MYSYGLIGNCNASALIHTNGRMDWLCLPRPDSEPVFGRLLDPNGGFFEISLVSDSPVQSKQFYIENTNILQTELIAASGEAIRITDFCPRFDSSGRIFRPLAVFRIVEPIGGNPFIRVTCKPITGWSKQEAKRSRHENCLKYEIHGETLYLDTTASVTLVEESKVFTLQEKKYFSISWGVPFEDELSMISEHFLVQTIQYWRTWVKHCSIPTLFQKEAIRSALALKLHCFEDTGAILAALTTSLPEEPGKERNWDYRFCWLRDSYFVLSAFHRLGHFEEMEGFIKFLLGIAQKHKASEERLAPVYTLSQDLPLPETLHPMWAGYEGSQPVRSFNQAAEHVQNDVYGEMILTLAPIFLDERFRHLRTREHESLLETYGRLCARSIGQPDAGLWEFREGWRDHSFSNLMCWAGLDRLEKIKNQGYLQKFSLPLAAEKNRAEAAVRRAVRSGSLRNGPDDDSFDASLSLLPILRFPDSSLSAETLQAIMKNLRLSETEHDFFYRYLRKDDFGVPHSAFLVCSFWIAQSLCIVGKKKEALELLAKVTRSCNHVGLYAEHFEPGKLMQCGNFPQAYSHVGLINAAFAVSPPWDEHL